MSREFDKKDLLIAACLRQNARETLVDIGKKTGMPVSSIHERLKASRKSFIEKCVALIDFEQLGFTARVFAALKVSLKQKAELGEFLVSSHHLNSVYKINNGFDFMFEGVFRHMKELEEFLERLDSKFKLKEKQVFFILDDLKKETFLSDLQTINYLNADVGK